MKVAAMSAGALSLARSVLIALCIVLAFESGWQVFAMDKVISFQSESPPRSAEALSAEAAPMLVAASGADAMFKIVQAQHVQIQEQYRLTLQLAASARRTAALAFAAAALAAIVLAAARFDGRPRPRRTR